MLEERAFTTLVLGVGNRLMSDEGIGVQVIEHLAAKYIFPKEVQILDGGTLGLDLVYYLEGIQNLLIVDAVETGREPGTLLRLEGDEVPAFLSIKISPHEIGVPDMLFAARLKGEYPPNVVLVGVQPRLIEIGLSLSPELQAKMPALIEMVIAELSHWGQKPEPIP